MMDIYDYEITSKYDNDMGAWVCSACGGFHDNLDFMAACHAKMRKDRVLPYAAPPCTLGANKNASPEINPAAPAYPPEHPAPPVQAPELLDRAAAHMYDRASTYDTLGGERSMGKAVAAFNAITGRAITESEGWLLLQVLKDVRNFSRNKPHQDSLEDCIAYSALKAEAEMRRLSEWEDR